MQWLLSMRQDDGGWAIPDQNAAVVAQCQCSPPTRPSNPAGLVKSRFFHRDVYPDRAAPSNWLIFSSPFGWTGLLSALDSLARIGLRAGDPDIARDVAWFIDHQDPGGLWNTGRNRPKGSHSDLRVGLAICRMLNAIST